MHKLDGGTDGDEFFEGLMDTKLMDGLIVFVRSLQQIFSKL